MTQPLYDNLNKISNEEFQNIMKETPLQEYFDISFQSNIQSFKERQTSNIYTIQTSENEEKEVFIKYITLVDFLKYLSGKYKNTDTNVLPCRKEVKTMDKYEKYINEPNNYAYVDSYFYHITSQFSKTYNFPHGIHCYDQFICQKKNCKINIEAKAGIERGIIMRKKIS